MSTHGKSRRIKIKTKYSRSRILFLIIGITFLFPFIYALTFITNSQSDFDAGTYNRTFFNNSGFVQLNTTFYNGTYTSEIFAAAGITSWSNISWTEGLPYGEGLPANQSNEEANGILGGINMTGNLLLLHFNNNSAFGENDTFVYDFSGSGNDGTCSGTTCGLYDFSSKVGAAAVDFDGADDYVDTSFTQNLDHITIATWIKPEKLGVASSGYILTGRGEAGGVTLWLAIDEVGDPLRLSINGVAGVLSTQPSGAVVGEWTHVAVTYDKSNVTFYVNGAENDKIAQNGSFIDSNGRLYVGAKNDADSGSNPRFYFNGSMDEFALWNRSLSAQEILNIYQRGAVRLNFTLRSCDDAACDGESWNQTVTSTPANLSLANNTYVQFRADFETDNITYSPQLHNVTIGHSLVRVGNPFFIETYGDGAARSFFAPNESIQIRTQGSFGNGEVVITITDSAGNVHVDEGQMANTSNGHLFNYTTNGSQGWYDVKINFKTWEKTFYQGEVWQGNYTDANNNVFTFRRQINVSEPGTRSRWFTPIDTLVPFGFDPHNSSVRVLGYNGSAMLEIPSQLYEINQTATGVSNARVVFLSSLNKSENRSYFIVSSKSNQEKNYTTDLVYNTTSDRYKIENSYFTSYFNVSQGGLMQDLFNKLGSNTSLVGTEPIDFYPEFDIGLTTFTARSDTTATINQVTGPIISIINVSGNANDIDSKPYTVLCKIYSKNAYMICEKNLSTTATENWKNFYLNGLIFTDGKYTNASYRNSSDGIVTRNMSSGDNADSSSLDSNMKWLTFYDTSTGDGVAELFINKSFSTTNSPIMEIVDDADNDFYRHLLISSTASSVSAGNSFYTKTARMIYNGIHDFVPVNETYDDLLNPVTVQQGSEITSDNENPRYTITGNVSSSDANNATVFSFWTDDSFLDFATINITGNSVNGTDSVLYYNASFTIRNSSAFVNESYVNVTLNPSVTEAGEIQTNITVFDVAGKSNSTLISFNLSDATAPSFDSITNTPDTAAQLDPNTQIIVEANITEFTALDAAVLYYRFTNTSGNTSEWNTTVMVNTSQTLFTQTLQGNFTPAAEGNYTYYIWANDTQGNGANSTFTNLSIFSDYTWLLQENFENKTETFDTNVSAGNITLNNTGDFNLTFLLSAGSLNDRTYFNGSQGETFFEVNANSSSLIPIIATTRSSGSIEGVDTFTITASNASATPTSNSTAFLVTTSAGGPFLHTEITQFNATVTQGDTDLPLTARVTNRGNETATGVNFTFILPTDWSVSSTYNLTDSVASIGVGSSSSFTTNVDVSSSATTGSQTITVNTTSDQGKNGSASVSVTVISSSPSSSSSSGGGGSSGSGGGGGGGGLAALKQETIETEAVYELVRGEDEGFSLLINNTFDWPLRNITANVTGFLSQYIEITGLPLELAPHSSANLTVHITAPRYLTTGEWRLNFSIQGIYTALFRTLQNTTATQIIHFSEKRAVLLAIHELGREDAATLLNTSSHDIATLEQLGLSTKKLRELLAEGEQQFKDRKYEKVQEFYEIIAERTSQALEAHSIIQEFIQKTTQANEEGVQTPETKRLILLAQSALGREDYESAFARLREIELTFALETKLAFSPLRYVQQHPWRVGFAGFYFLLFVISIFFKIKIEKINSELRRLLHEKEILRGLMKTAQYECFEKNTIDMSQYNTTMLQYENRMTAVIQRIIALESLKASLIRPAHRRLALEQQRLLDLIKQTQDEYIVKGKQESGAYKSKIHSYATKLSEVEGKIIVKEAEVAIRNEKILKWLRVFGIKKVQREDKGKEKVKEKTPKSKHKLFRVLNTYFGRVMESRERRKQRKESARERRKKKKQKKGERKLEKKIHKNITSKKSTKKRRKIIINAVIIGTLLLITATIFFVIRGRIDSIDSFTEIVAFAQEKSVTLIENIASFTTTLLGHLDISTALIATETVGATLLVLIIITAITKRKKKRKKERSHQKKQKTHPKKPK